MSSKRYDLKYHRSQEVIIRPCINYAAFNQISGGKAGHRHCGRYRLEHDLEDKGQLGSTR